MITSTGNQQVKYVAQLQKKSKTRLQERVFVVEGPKMVLETPPHLLQQIYVTEDFFREPAYRDRLRQLLKDSGCKWETVSESVLKAMSDTQTPQGILALVTRMEYSLEDLFRKENPHILVLESIQDPGNLGTMIRTGEGAGINGILCNATTVDFFSPKVIRSTMGSLYRVPFVVTEDLPGAIKELKKRGVRTFAAHLQGTSTYEKMDFTGPTAFFIGNEGNGLSDAIASLADSYLRIPMEGQVESLNAAVSAALLMYETHRQRNQSSSMT